MRVVAILTAAGLGARLGAQLPKALVELAGEPLVVHAARALASVAGATVVTVPPGHEAEFRRVLQAASLEAVVVPGGPSRQASVAAGLAALADHPDDTVVLVHDAARPAVPRAVVQRIADAVAAGREAVVPGLPVPDTVKHVEPQARDLERVTATVDRAVLRVVQTPQGFTLGMLRAAHAGGNGREADERTAATDDAALVEAIGGTVWMVPGDEQGRKVTTQRDLAALEGAAPPRTGIAVDVHAFADPGDDRPMWLAGLHWPDESGLLGHSDGDAAAHAAAEALLSAAGIGDLGSLLGIDDPAWAGGSGQAVLAAAARAVREAGYEIGNVAVQVVAARPKLAPRRAEAEAVLTAACGAPVSLTATTTDGLGLTGRGEGVVAIATALVLCRRLLPEPG